MKPTAILLGLVCLLPFSKAEDKNNLAAPAKRFPTPDALGRHILAGFAEADFKAIRHASTHSLNAEQTQQLLASALDQAEKDIDKTKDAADKRKQIAQRREQLKDPKFIAQYLQLNQRHELLLKASLQNKRQIAQNIGVDWDKIVYLKTDVALPKDAKPSITQPAELRIFFGSVNEKVCVLRLPSCIKTDRWGWLMRPASFRIQPVVARPEK